MIPDIDRGGNPSTPKSAAPDLRDFLTAVAGGLAPYVVEFRALKVPTNYGKPFAECGYFDLADPASINALCRVVDGYGKRQPAKQPRGLYITVNPLNPALLARAKNRVSRDVPSSNDSDVIRRRIFPLDIDPVRPSDISASDEEKLHAREVFDAVTQHLAEAGWAPPLAQDSGNGYQGWYPIDLPTDDGGIVERVLQSLAKRFGTELAKVDTTLFNPSRIAKLPGTWARKGDDLPERPHRRARVLSIPGTRSVTAAALVSVLADELPPKGASRPQANGTYTSRLLVEKWLTDRGIGFRKKGRDSNGRAVYVLEHCPFDASHADPDACVMQATDGELSAICLHNSCAGRGWKEFKAVIGPPDGHHYDPPIGGKTPKPPGGGKTLSVKSPEGFSEPHEYPRPLGGESWDDPHRVARLFDAEHRTDDGEQTLLQWRDEWHEWCGAAWRVVPDSDLDARLVRHARDVFETDYPRRVAEAQFAAEQGGNKKPSKPPTMFKVTTKVKGDARLNLAAQTNHPDTEADQPFWLAEADGDQSADRVLSAPNGLFTLEDVAAGKPAFAHPTPRLFTPTALPFPVPTNPPTPALWLKCVNEWFAGDEASIAGLQEWMGYLLSADTSMHKALFLVGPKRSGKGTILDTTTKLVGEANVASITFGRLGENFGLEPLLGKRVAIIPDGRLSGRADISTVVERLLSISGEDAQSVNRKNRRCITTKLRVRFVIASNEVPRLPDASGALASRFHILHTPNSWIGKEDRTLKDRLRAELPEILCWAARGWMRLQEQGAFTPNEAAEQYARQLDDLSSPIRAFLRDACSIGPVHSVEIPELFQAWRDWNEQRHREVGSEAVFGRDLRAACGHVRDGQVRRDGVRVRIYRGVGLRERSDWGSGEATEEGVSRDVTRAGLTHALDFGGEKHPVAELESHACHPVTVDPRPDPETDPDEFDAWATRQDDSNEVRAA